MPKLPLHHVPPALPSREEAVVALRRIRQEWSLDWSDIFMVLGTSGDSMSDITWTEDCLLRIGYLIALDQALHELGPRAGIARWLATPNPGPFFGGDSPFRTMSGGIHELAHVLEQVHRWNRERR